MLTATGIKFCDPVDTWRKSTIKQPSILFTFERPQVRFGTIRNALYQRFSQTTFDRLHVRHNNGRCLVVEAVIFNDQERSQIIKESVRFGSLTLNAGGYKVDFKAWPTLPNQPDYNIYKVEGLSSLSESDVRADVWDGIIDRLRELSSSRGWSEDDAMDCLVDVVSAYETNATVPYFAGTVYIVLQNGDFGSRNYFKMNGRKVDAGSSNSHYAYCCDCRWVDSHLTIDCPLPIQTSFFDTSTTDDGTGDGSYYDGYDSNDESYQPTTYYNESYDDTDEDDYHTTGYYY